MKVSSANLHLNLSEISTFLLLNIMLLVSELYRINIYNCDNKIKLDIVLTQNK